MSSFLNLEDFIKLRDSHSQISTKYVLIVSEYELPTNTMKIVKHAQELYYADGGANRMFSFLKDDDKVKYLPRSIIGDFNTIKPYVRSYYESKNINFEEVVDQDTNQLQKAFMKISPNLKEGDYVVVIGGIGGILDKEYYNLHCSYLYPQFRTIFVDDNNIATVLRPGDHKIKLRKGLKCGLIPINGPVNLTTEGLKWNLGKGNISNRLEFGGIVSTSNIVEQEEIQIRCSDPVLLNLGFVKDEM